LVFVSEADHAVRGARALFRLEQGAEIPGFSSQKIILTVASTSHAQGKGPLREIRAGCRRGIHVPWAS